MADPAPAPALTTEQQQILDRARILRAAREQRQAEADAEINAAAGVTDAAPYAPAKEFVRATGEGAISLADLPSRFFTSATNAQTRMANAGVHLDGEQYVTDETPPAVQQPLKEPWTPAGDFYNRTFQPNPDYPGVRKAGNILGSTAPMIVAPELAAGGFGALPGALVDTAATTGATYFGGQGGRLIDQSLGGSGDKGEFFGSLIGSGVTPIVSNLVSRGLTDANSIARFNDAKLAGVEKPDMSLVGNDFASGWGSKSNQAVQQAQIDKTLRDLSAARRGTPGSPVPASGPFAEGNVGRGVIDLSKTGAERAAADADAAYRAGIASRLDQNTPIPSEAPALRQLLPNAEPTFQRPLVEEILNSIEDSHLNAAGAGPRYVDPAAQAGLEANVTLRQRELDRLTQSGAPSSRVETAKQDLAQAQDALAGNQATTFNDIKVRRGRVQQSLDADVGDRFILSETQKAQTNAMRDAALAKGITPEEFDAVNAKYATLKDRQAELEKLAQAKEGPAYNTVFGKGGEKSYSTLQALQQNADPQALGKLLADNLELRARGVPVAGRPELPRDVGINAKAADWWDSLTPEVRDAYFPAGSPERARIDATMRTIRGDSRRGGSQTEAPSIATPAAAGALVTGHPGAALAVMTPRIGSALAGGIMRNPRFTEAMLARRANPLTPLDLARTISAYVGSQQSQ